MRGALPLAVVLVAVSSAAVLPYPRPDGRLVPDAVEYLSIGWFWANGAGFVDPVQWVFVLDPAPVLPASAVRPPVVPFLFGLAFRLGATLWNVVQLHVLATAMVAGLVTLVARRMMGLSSAIGVGLLVGTAPAWSRLAPMPLTEVASVAIFLAVLGTTPRAVRSVGAAFLCAVLTVIAAFTRPNLMGMGLAVAVGMAWTLGPRDALRSRTVWIYLVTFVLLLGGVRVVALWTTGLAPYAAQALLAGRWSATEALTYGFEAGEGSALWGERGARMLFLFVRRAGQLATSLFFSRSYLWVGWIALPGSLWCLFRRGSSVTRRVCALAALGFSLTVALTFAAFDGQRYPILPAIVGALCGFAMLDDLVAGTAMRWPRLRRGIGLVPLGLALVLAWPQPWTSLPRLHQRTWLGGSRDPPMVPPSQADLVGLCAGIPPDALVAAAYPWAITLYCGNPSIRLPGGLTTGDTERRFLEERKPLYVVAPRVQRYFASRPMLYRRNGRYGDLRLFRTTMPASDVNRWEVPPPLRCAGFSARTCPGGGR